MSANLTAQSAQAAWWQEATELLDTLELCCPGGLTDDAWDAVMPLVDRLDPTVGRDVVAIRAAAAQAVAAAEPQPEPEAVTEPEPEAVTEPEPQPEPEAVTEPEPQPEPEAVTEPEPQPEPQPAEDDATLSWVDVAVAVLRKAGTELSAREIYTRSVADGPTRPTTAKTPWQTINRDLHAAIRRGDARVATGSKRGRFTAA